MHEINLYQTHLTEGQWSYINKEFLENDSRKRKYSLQSVLKPSSTFWSAGVNGGDFHMTIPNGRVSIITTINGGRRDGLNIFAKTCQKNTAQTWSGIKPDSRRARFPECQMG